MIFKNIKINIFKKSGFSLLEILIYVSIFSILVLLISDTFISISKGQGQSNAKNEVNSSIRFAGEIIRQDIKNASTVSMPSLAGDTSSSLSLTRDGVSVLYDVSDGVLRRTENGGSPVNITNNNIFVSNPIFKKLESNNNVFNTKNTTIKIEMIFDYKSSSPDFQYGSSFQTSVNLFNYD